jgi:hypothetical protein
LMLLAAHPVHPAMEGFHAASSSRPCRPIAIGSATKE